MKKYSTQAIFDKLHKEWRQNHDICNINMGQPDEWVKPFLHRIIADIMQEWLEGWLHKNGIAYSPNPNTQMPPDVFLDPDDMTSNLLEVKAFNYSATPGFDIADFNAFQEEIIEKPYMLHVKYLVFGYEMQDDGYVVIKDMWLKNIWEICGAMAEWPLNLQVKDNVVHKIRPAKWYTNGGRFHTFNSLEDFLSAMEETVYQNPKTHNVAGTWKSRFIAAYRQFYNRTLTIPHWNAIETNYR